MEYQYKRYASGKGYYVYRDTHTGRFTSQEKWIAEREAEYLHTTYEKVTEIEYPKK